MWNQTKKHNAFAITFTPRIITGSWLSFSSTSRTIQLRSHHRAQLDNLELERLIIFNPTKISQLLTSWYQTCHQAMPVLCTVSGPSVHEQIIPMVTANPKPEQFPIDHAPNWHWKHSYLYSLDNNHYFYLSGIKKSLLFQYQLLGITASLDLRTITTERTSLLCLYRFLLGSAFTSAKLATDLLQRNNTIEQLFSADDLSRMLSIPSNYTIEKHDVIPLLAACGLLVTEGNSI